MISTLGVSQDEVKNVFSNQLTFGVLGNTGLLIYKYNTDKSISNRITLYGFYQSKNVENQYQMGPGIKNLGTRQNMNVSLGYGLQKNNEVSDKINFFFGADFLLGYSSMKSIDGWEVEDSTIYADFGYSYYSFSNASNGDFERRERVTTASSLTLRPILGFDYLILDRLKLGVEYQVSLLRASYFFGNAYKFDSKNGENQISREDRGASSIEMLSTFNGRTAVTVSYLF